MIEIDWFDRVLCLAEADLKGRNAAELCAELGVVEEVVPFLLVSAEGFADWPLSRQAVRGAIRAVPRAPNTPAHPQLGPQAGLLRRDLRSALRSILIDHANPSAQERDDRSRWKASQLIARYGSSTRENRSDPTSFIDSDQS